MRILSYGITNSKRKIRRKNLAFPQTNGPLSHLLSEILDAMADELDEKIGTECRSTEELVAGVEQVNDRGVENPIVVFSMDVAALYPNLKSDVVAKETATSYNELELEIEVDEHQLGIYLMLTLGREKLVNEKLGFVTPTRLATHGPAPGITTEEIFSECLASKFKPASRKPTAKQKRHMIALALEQGILAVMKGHVYEFNGQAHKQTEGGPIGLQLSGSLARVFMLLWDRKFLEVLEKSTRHLEWDLHLMMRYVDDSNSVTDILPPGARFENGKVKIKPDCIESDMSVKPDLRTARVIKDVANSLYSFIQMTVDCPSLHEVDLVPILDLQVGVKNNLVVYQHFTKPCSSFLLTHQRSAMSTRAKHVTLLQEVVRICRNTSKRLPEEAKTTALSVFSYRLKESGYGAAKRLKVLQDGMKAFENQVERDRNGTCPLYRPKGYDKINRRNKKAVSRMGWYRPHDTVVFIPPTPYSELKRQLQQIANKTEEECGIKVRLVERSGSKLHHLVPGLQSQTTCQEEKCFLHMSGSKGDHRSEGAVYKGVCDTCLEKGPSSFPDQKGNIISVTQRKPGTKSGYFGETSRNTLVRGEHHLTAIQSPEFHQDNAFSQHSLKYHQGEKPDYSLSIVGCHPRPLERQIWEGVLIRKGEKELDILMNSKQDHFAPAVGRLVVRHAVGD